MRITRFSSMIPALSDRHLQKGTASLAINAKTWDGTLRAFRHGATAEACPAGCTSQTPLGSPGQITVMNGKLVHSGDGSVVGLSAPVAAPYVTVSEPGHDIISFRYSFVNEYGEESRKSEASLPTPVGVKALVTVLARSYPIRLYAYVTDSADGSSTSGDTMTSPFSNEVFVGEFNSDPIFQYDLETWGITASGYDSDDWCTPTDVKCLASNDDGYTAAYNDRGIWISERHMPNAYPLRQYIECDSEIVDIIPYYDTFFVLTKGAPALLRNPLITTGEHQGMSSPSLNYYKQQHPCIGPAVATDFGVVYPSKMGLVGLTPTVPDGMQLMTRNAINEDTWFDSMLPKVAAWFQGVYFAWNASIGYRLDIKDNNHGAYEFQTFVRIDPAATKVCVQGGDLVVDGKVFNRGDRFSGATWISERYVEQGVRAFSVAKVTGNNLAGVKFIFREAKRGVIIDRTLKDEDSNIPFRLPLVRGMEFFVELHLPESDREVVIKEVHIAASLPELSKAD